MSATEQFLPYLMNYHSQVLTDILRSNEPDQHFGVPISLTHMASIDPLLVDTILAAPRTVLPTLDSTLRKAQDELMAQPHPDRHLLFPKENIHARLIGPLLFLDSTLSTELTPTISTLGSAHLDRLITVRGTVVRTSAVKMLQARRLYECSKCRHQFQVTVDLEAAATVTLPRSCPSIRDKPCQGGTFKHVEEVALYTNYQEVQLQEGSRCLSLGSSPRTLTVLLLDDLADTCQVGDEVEVCGVVVRQFGPHVGFPGMRCHLSLGLLASSVSISADRRCAVEVTPEAEASFLAFWEAHKDLPLQGRNKMIAGMCPQLCGLFIVKLTSLLMLAGGVSGRRDANESPNRNADDDARGSNGARGEIHVLLVGDPGTGKSQFMKYIAALSPRAVTVGGRASSAAGLTAAAVKDGGNWSLEAGALVLADGGVCCIDEFDCVREADRAALHEAMEQQTCSVAKAGVVTTLHTRASVFGTCNPKGNRRYDSRRPLAEQLNIGGPLLSRFDVVLLLIDRLDPQEDEVVANHILSESTNAAAAMQKNRRGSRGYPELLTQINKRNDQNTTELAAGGGEGWTVEVLRQYLQWIKTTFQPRLTPEAEAVLSGYYRLRRGAEGRHAARTTLRMLESLVRLTQAHARLMARHEATLQDAVVVVALTEASCAAEGEGSFRGAMNQVIPGIKLCAEGGHFPDDPDGEYVVMENKVLAALGLRGGDNNR